MCIPRKILWCFILLFVVSYSASHGNSTKILTNCDVKQSYNSTFQRQLDLIDDRKLKNPNDEINSTWLNLPENFINNEMPYEPCINSTKNETKNDHSEQFRVHKDVMKDYEERNQTSVINFPPYLRKFNHDAKIKKNDGCIRLCCQEYVSISGKCIDSINTKYSKIYQVAKLLDEWYDYYTDTFCTMIEDPCFKRGRRLRNVSIIDGRLQQYPNKSLLLPTDFCLAMMSWDSFRDDTVYMIVCTNDNEAKYPVYLSVCLLVSLPFLLLTFVVYTVLPELQNVHGYTLRAHIASLFVTYVFMFCGTKISRLQEVDDTICCIITAYVFHFFFLSSFFWLNVICFDIWWTFRKIRLCRTNIKQAKKKFVIYSMYAWGIPLIITITCAIMDNVDGIPDNWKPKICVDKFWFSTVEAKKIYFYVPMVATIISNICFFISTTVSIIHQTIRTANHLRTSDNKNYNKNKHRIKMFLKLFVMMIYGGIIWAIEVIAWTNADFLPSFVWYPTDMLNSLQGVIIFIIFVCKNKIKQLLLIRFGGQTCGPLCIIRTYNDSTASNVTSTSTTGSSQQIDSFNQQPILQNLENILPECRNTEYELKTIKKL